MEDIEKATNDLLQVSSLPPVFLILRSAPPSPSFPLTHPLMVIYLVGKGSAFSPERSTTGREQRQRWKKERGGGEENEKIYQSCRSPRRHRLCLLLSLTAVMEVKAWPQRVGRRKNYMSIFVPTGCPDRNRYITCS